MNIRRLTGAYNQTTQSRMISSTAQSVSSAASASSKEQQRWKRRIEKYDHRGRVLLTQKGFDPDDLHKADEIGHTPMTYFCDKGNERMCRYLLARGAYDQTRDQNGFSPCFGQQYGVILI